MVFLNNNGQVLFFGLMLGITIIILSLAFAPILKSFNDDARNASTNTSVGLDCNNSSISDFTKGQCMIQDASTPYFIIGLFVIGGVVLTIKTITA